MSMDLLRTFPPSIAKSTRNMSKTAVTSEVAAGLVLANLEHRSVIGAELSVIGASTLGTKSFVQSHPR
jgi:hypothetical protein